MFSTAHLSVQQSMVLCFEKFAEQRPKQTTEHLERGSRRTAVHRASRDETFDLIEQQLTPTIHDSSDDEQALPPVDEPDAGELSSDSDELSNNVIPEAPSIMRASITLRRLLANASNEMKRDALRLVVDDTGVYTAAVDLRRSVLTSDDDDDDEDEESNSTSIMAPFDTLLEKALGELIDEPDGMHFFPAWREAHARILDLTIVFEQMGVFPPYVMLEIFDHLDQFSRLPHYRKIKLILAVQASIRKIYANRVASGQTTPRI
eukprot:CAMPEP_0168595840 /NCGR_PEP_ID=MMETSP0420-20121227/9690_1 /TAXON_ID=498008 /ORGANISM="Pessonella sp." /LENGTH=261 /DNA_ID=CAMNT_0008632341 /DNA_START=767 /DNA_END=1549 /DNA_ORIENTATION=+